MDDSTAEPHFTEVTLSRPTEGAGLYDKQENMESFAPEPKNCCARLNHKLWDSGPLNITEKTRNHLRANTLVSDTTLMVVRIVMFLLNSCEFTNWSVRNANSGHPFINSYKYFTTWGLNMTELYLLLAVSAYILNCFDNPKKEHRNPYACFEMWKWVTIVYQVALTWETVITIVYWSILWSTENHANHSWWYYFWRTALVHILPLVYLLIDYSMNRFYFEESHIWIITGTMVAYGGVNIAVTKITGKPVYGPLSWDSLFSWGLGLALLPFAIGTAYAWFALTKCKFKKLRMETNTVMFQSIRPQTAVSEV
jgi:hypothetical protein